MQDVPLLLLLLLHGEGQAVLTLHLLHSNLDHWRDDQRVDRLAGIGRLFLSIAAGITLFEKRMFDTRMFAAECCLSADCAYVATRS